MTTKVNQCPYCGAQFSLSPQNLEHLKEHDWLNCSKCGLFVTVALDENRSSIVSIEKYTEPINLGTFHSTKLNKDFLITEPPIPTNVSNYLADGICNIRWHLVVDPKNPSSQVFRDQRSRDWTVNFLVPKILPVYNEYPNQVAYIITGLGLAGLLSPYLVECSVCGAGILKVRQDKCPICKNSGR